MRSRLGHRPNQPLSHGPSAALVHLAPRKPSQVHTEPHMSSATRQTAHTRPDWPTAAHNPEQSIKQRARGVALSSRGDLVDRPGRLEPAQACSQRRTKHFVPVPLASLPAAAKEDFMSNSRPSGRQQRAREQELASHGHVGRESRAPRHRGLQRALSRPREHPRQRAAQTCSKSGSGRGLVHVVCILHPEYARVGN